jgi:REP element-mobilizing transposase RayT
MTAPRQILPGQTYLITRRATQRQHLLRPDPDTNQCFEYNLAVSANRCAIQLLAWLAMSNHYHAVVHDPEGRLPEFLEHFHKFTAKTLNARWGRSENFWSSEETSVVLLETLEDVLAKVVYVLANPINDQLVDRVTDWPGASARRHFLHDRPVSIDRPGFYFRKNGRMPESVSLRAVPPPGVDRDTWARLVLQALDARERAVRAARLQRGSAVLGRKAVLATSPFDRPSSREPRRNLRPTVAARDRSKRLCALAALRTFRERYARARTLFISGRRDVVFPAGTYRLRLLGAACELPCRSPPLGSGA